MAFSQSSSFSARFTARLIAACAVFAGCSLSISACGSSSTNDGTGNGDTADAGSADAGPARGIALPASQADWALDRDLSFKGKGAGDLGAISLEHGIGTIELKGETANAFLFAHSAVPAGDDDGGASNGGGASQSEVDYQIIAAQPERLIMMWITCEASDLAWVYYETTDGIASEKEMPASGSCTAASTNVTEAVSLPPVGIDPPAVVSGFTIEGADIAFDGAHPGTANLGGETFSLYPFHVIDCSTCSQTGWQELHSLLWNPQNGSACLGILYLQANDPARVELGWILRLPSVSSFVKNGTQFYDATWTQAK